MKHPLANSFIQAKHYRPGRLKAIKLIIIHSMEAPEKGQTAENVARYFATTSVVASAHFCVDVDSIIQCVDVKDIAFHCKNANANGIGIEHAGYARQTEAEWLDDYSSAMLRRSAELVGTLCITHGIPIERVDFSKPDPTGICGHVDVPGHGSHTDPGKGFPMEWYLARVREWAGD